MLLYDSVSVYHFILLEANKVAEVAKIQFEQKVMEKEKQKEMSRIDDETKIARLKAQADANYYTAQKEADSNNVRKGCIHARVHNMYCKTTNFSVLLILAILANGIKTLILIPANIYNQSRGHT